MKIPIGIICMLSLLISACIGCSNIYNDNAVSLPDAIYTEKNGVRVSVEPAIELYAVILSLLDRPVATHLNIDYKESISEFFSDMSDHDTVLFVNSNLGDKLLLKLDMSYVITLMT